ncbi:MAG: single-stranded-DNA-specific exonuclease RecJ [Lachnospiraceae bacterium]|nr:single-stranded-DNA-specific exonuclease RecJ [Lachnospiraceae bacterium]
MKKQWMVYTKKAWADYTTIGKEFQISPVLARVIRNRGVDEKSLLEEYLHGNRENFHDGRQMKDLTKAGDLLLEKIQQQKKIRIVGDYDCDGVSSIYILYRGITELGGNVDYAIPHRVHDGYGINENMVEKAVEEGVDTLLTCDNGIAARSALSLAKNKGLTVIVTDHHDIPYEEQDGKKVYILPEADAVVDPIQEDCTYPFKELCGAMVAYKLIEYLYQVRGLRKERAEFFDSLLEIGGLATVVDVMPLLGENRIIVKEALKLMRRTRNLGLKALMEVQQVEPEQLRCYHLGFTIGPCVNASGRLDTAERALKLFLSKNPKEALALAMELKLLNDERKQMQEDQVEEAIRMVEQMGEEKDSVLVLYLPECHESIAGIVAGKIREKFYRPTFVITKTEDGLKGSGRSTEEYSMSDKLSECKDLLTKFGGHPMAAGLSLEEKNLEALRLRLNANANLSKEDLIPKVWIDCELPIGYVNSHLIQELDLLEPSGNGNEKPLFGALKLRVEEPRLRGKNQDTFIFRAVDERGEGRDCILFHCREEEAASYRAGDMVNILYSPRLNTYMGEEKVQLQIKEIRHCGRG